MKLGDSPETIYVAVTPLVSNGDVAAARVIETDERFNIGIEFTSAASAHLQEATRGHIGKPIAIIVNGHDQRVIQPKGS